MKKLLLLFAVFAICSCSGKFDEDAVRETTNQFFTNLQNQNWTMVNQIYPEFSKITSYHNFINYAIENMVYEKGKGICVNIDLEYLTNRLSPPSHYKMKLFFDRNKETKTYYIKDSQSFAMFERDGYLYQYAIKTGCLNELTDVMDIAISEKLIAANEMYNHYFEKVKGEVTSATPVTLRKISMYGGSHSYRMYKITNNSSYDLVGVRYNATVTGKKGTIYSVVRENFNNKKLQWNTLESGTWCEFDPFGDPYNNEISSNLSLILDDAIHNILQSQTTYVGDEYEKYLLEKQTI